MTLDFSFVASYKKLYLKGWARYSRVLLAPGAVACSIHVEWFYTQYIERVTSRKEMPYAEAGARRRVYLTRNAGIQ